MRASRRCDRAHRTSCRARQEVAKGDAAAARKDLEAGVAAAAKIPVARMRDATRDQLQRQLDALK